MAEATSCIINKPQISVIIPVYKAEAYLSRCIDSILSQTFKDFELLLIDDGSPDRSGKICDVYAKKDARITVFHQQNGGVSSARQKGQDEARGEYTIHADPDDWVEPSMLEELYKKAKEEKADMVICDYYQNEGDVQTYVKQKPSSLDRTTVLKELFQQLHGSCWNKLVRRVCYSKTRIRFPLNMNCWEDRFVNVCLLLDHSFKVTYLPKAFYHYDVIENPNSLVRKPSKQTVLSQKYFIETLSPLLGKDFEEDMYRLKVQTKDLAWRFGLLDKDEYDQLFPEIKEQYTADFGSSSNITKRFVILSFKHYQIAKMVYSIIAKLNDLLKKLYGKK